MIDKIPTKKEAGFLIVVALLVLIASCVPKSAHASLVDEDNYEHHPMAHKCVNSSLVVKNYFYAVRDSGMTRSDVIAKTTERDDPRIPGYLITLNAVNLANAFFNSGTPDEARELYLASCLDMLDTHIREMR